MRRRILPDGTFKKTTKTQRHKEACAAGIIHFRLGTISAAHGKECLWHYSSHLKSHNDSLLVPLCLGGFPSELTAPGRSRKTFGQPVALLCPSLLKSGSEQVLMSAYRLIRNTRDRNAGLWAVFRQRRRGGLF
jgi:hypothetical protein